MSNASGFAPPNNVVGAVAVEVATGSRLPVEVAADGVGSGGLAVRHRPHNVRRRWIHSAKQCRRCRRR